MKPEEINREIAELVGWDMWMIRRGLFFRSHSEEEWELEPKNPVLLTRPDAEAALKRMKTARLAQLVPAPPPNYHGSLDACAEFEATLDGSVRLNEYADMIEAFHGYDERGDLSFANLIRLTAPQRCEAFLRLHGKWREK